MVRAAAVNPIGPSGLMFLAQLFRRSPYKDEAHALYALAVQQARQPAFYAACGAPDTLDGRFDLIVVHAFLVLRGLKRGGEVGERTGQTVLEVMFDDMDQNLREMGVGDLSVGKKVKAMARAFFGRSKAYADALEPMAEPSALESALERNIYGRDLPEPARLSALVGYVRAADAAIAAQAIGEILAGRIAFPPAPHPDVGQPAD